LNTKEEVKGQIAEALLGSEQIFANALEGGDTKKFQAGMKAAKYTEKDLLKVAAEMKRMVSDKDLAEMLHTPEKMVVRMRNAWGDLLSASNDAGFWDLMANGIESVTEALKDLTPHIKDIAGIIKNVSMFVWENKGVLIPFAIGLRMVGSGIAMFTSAAAAGRVLSMAGAFRVLGMSMVTAFLAPLAAISAVVLALDTYEAYTQHKKGLVADFREAKVDSEGKTEVENSLDLPNSTPEEKKVRDRALFGSNWQWFGTEKKTMPDSVSIEKRYELAQRMRAEPDRGYGRNTIPDWVIKAENDMNAVRRENTLQLGGMSSNAPQTINITVQNTEPNVTKDWLSSVLPSVLGNALQQHVQKEAAFTPNMLLR
jgi:hypothetical protein